MVELMIVMVIIGILGSVAIPGYQNYVVRAKVMNLLSTAQPIKMAVTESLLEGGEARIEKLTNQGGAREITVAGNVITIIGDSAKLGVPADKVLKLVLTPNVERDRIVWKCAVDPIDLSKFVPVECRSE